MIYITHRNSNFSEGLAINNVWNVNYQNVEERYIEFMHEKAKEIKNKISKKYFWAEVYYVSTVGLNEATIKKYIQEQEKHDIALDKLSVKEYENPFRDNGK